MNRYKVYLEIIQKYPPTDFSFTSINNRKTRHSLKKITCRWNILLNVMPKKDFYSCRAKNVMNQMFYKSICQLVNHRIGCVKQVK